MIKRIDHIEIIVRDLDEYVRMLSKLGLRLLSRTTHHGDSVEMKLPGGDQPIFEIHKVSGEENIGINHIAFLVDNVGDAYRSLRGKGIKFEEGPRFIPATGRTIANFRDSDGWRLQLVDSTRSRPKERNTSAR